MTDESLDEQLDGVARQLPLDVEAGLGAALRMHREAERDRVVAPGRSDDGRRYGLLVVQEADGSWSLGSVRMTADTAASLAEWILARAQ